MIFKPKKKPCCRKSATFWAKWKPFKLQDFEERAVEQVKNSAKAADEYINEKPYYAMGFAALAGLVVGVLLNRR